MGSQGPGRNRRHQIAIINGGGIRSGLNAGEITMGEMYAIFPLTIP